MRLLTIERRRCSAACLRKMKVYWEDPNGKAKINGVKCSFLGMIKNGETKTFEITDNAGKVFVVKDRLAKSLTCDFYQLPEGNENILLTGENSFNLFSDFSFRFDNNDSPEAKKHHKKQVLKVVLMYILVFILGIALGVGLVLYNEAPKTFTNGGMHIVLTNEFDEMQIEGYDNCYSSDEMAVVTVKESFDSDEEFSNLSIEEYGKILLEVNEFDSDIQHKNGLTWFEHEYYNEEEQQGYYYYSYLFKSKDAFWLVEITVREENKHLKETVEEIAKSITFE